MEPAERQEKIPTESQKEKERVRDCKGNESLLQLGRKLLLGRGGRERNEERKRRRDRSEETAANGREKERVATILLRPRREREERGSLGQR